jgi:hypothetical protein
VDYNDEVKRTNEIKTAAPMLDAIDIAGRVITADALLTQRELAHYLVSRGAHYHFTVKGNQPTLHEDIRALFAQRGAPHHTEVSPPDHGRIETRRIWCSNRLNHYVAFPHVGQVFLIEREPSTRSQAAKAANWHWASRAAPPSKPARPACCASTAATGRSRTAVTMCWT